MSSTATLIKRNQVFANQFAAADLPILPKLRTVILACGDSRVDPAHVLGLALGDSVVIRNNGGRVTQDVVNEIATLAFMVSRMDGDRPGAFELVLMQHTGCGAERFADPQFQSLIRQQLGIDVSQSAIADHEQSLRDDVERLRREQRIPRRVVVSGYLYDIQTGLVHEVIAPAALG